MLIACSSRGFAVTSAHYPELVKPAFERAVPQGRARRRLQPDQLRQPQVGGEEIAAPAGEIALQRVAELGVEARELLFASHPLAVGRIRDHDAGRGGRSALEYVRLLERHP